MVDIQFAMFLDNFSQFTATLLVVCSVVCWLVPSTAPFMVVGAGVYVASVMVVDRNNREVKRMSNAAMAPLLSTVAECVNGRTLLRVTGEQGLMRRRFARNVDEYGRHNFLSGAFINWGSLVSYFISATVSSTTVAFILINRKSYTAAYVGLALTYSFLVPYFLLHYSFIAMMLKMALTSLERVVAYKGAAVPQELEWYKNC